MQHSTQYEYMCAASVKADYPEQQGGGQACPSKLCSEAHASVPSPSTCGKEQRLQDIDSSACSVEVSLDVPASAVRPEASPTDGMSSDDAVLRKGATPHRCMYVLIDRYPIYMYFLKVLPATGKM